MARAAIWKLDQLSPDCGVRGVAPVACATCAAASRWLADPRSHQGEGLMGWLILMALVGLSLGCLWLLGVRSGLLTTGAAALMVGAAGYAFQGSPDLRGAPARNAEA